MGKSREAILLTCFLNAPTKPMEMSQAQTVRRTGKGRYLTGNSGGGEEDVSWQVGSIRKWEDIYDLQQQRRRSNVKKDERKRNGPKEKEKESEALNPGTVL